MGQTLDECFERIAWLNQQIDEMAIRYKNEHGRDRSQMLVDAIDILIDLLADREPALTAAYLQAISASKCPVSPHRSLKEAIAVAELSVPVADELIGALRRAGHLDA